MPYPISFVAPTSVPIASSSKMVEDNKEGIISYVHQGMEKHKCILSVAEISFDFVGDNIRRHVK